MEPEPDRRVEKALRRLRTSPLREELRRARDAAPCPPPEALDRFRRGASEEREAAEIAHHVLGCSGCAADVLARARIDDEGERDLRPAWSLGSLFRHPGLGLVAAAAAVLIGGIALSLFLRGGIGIEASIRGDRGLVRGGEAALAGGERFRLDLRLGKPAAVAVFLEDQAGAISLVYPAEGEAPVLDGAASLPGPGEAWGTDDLAPGAYALWIVAARRPISRREAASLAGPIGEARGEVLPRAGGRPEVLDKVRKALAPGIEEIVERPFRIE
jgi:hypothetical protein